ncbi:MAG: hypothetical protein FWC89_03340 [Defluviitaleaceae bacterium]|nr:hypothetical protein [Defluviitaleaceae bacterium]
MKKKMLATLTLVVAVFMLTALTVSNNSVKAATPRVPITMTAPKITAAENYELRNMARNGATNAELAAFIRLTDAELRAIKQHADDQIRMWGSLALGRDQIIQGAILREGDARARALRDTGGLTFDLYTVDMLTSITLPNRRLTDEERQEWIADYWVHGGPTPNELEAVRLVNIERANHNLVEVEICDILMMSARFFTQQGSRLGRTIGSVNTGGAGHNFGPYATDLDASHGASRKVVRAFGGELRWNGGNLAGGGHLSAESTVNAWMNSPGHRAYILSPEHRFIGFGQFPQGGNYLFLSDQSPEQPADTGATNPTTPTTPQTPNQPAPTPQPTPAPTPRPPAASGTFTVTNSGTQMTIITNGVNGATGTTSGILSGRGTTNGLAWSVEGTTITATIGGRTYTINPSQTVTIQVDPSAPAPTAPAPTPQPPAANVEATTTITHTGHRVAPRGNETVQITYTRTTFNGRDGTRWTCGSGRALNNRVGINVPFTFRNEGNVLIITVVATGVEHRLTEGQSVVLRG